MNKLFVRILKKFGVLKYLNIYSSVTIRDKKFIVPVMGGVGMSNLFMSELWMIDLLERLLTKEDVKFVDVGVNLGQTLIKVRTVSAGIEYVGLEPNSVCVQYVHKLILENDLRHIQIVPVGISDDNRLGRLYFHVDDDADSCASILQDFRESRRMEYVPLFTYGAARKSLNDQPVSILKIDVEGAELEVLRGFHDEIVRSQPVIIMEILPVYKRENVERFDRQNRIEKTFHDLRYQIYRINKQAQTVESLSRLHTIGIHGDIKNCDYLIIPESKIHRLKDFRINPPSQ